MTHTPSVTFTLTVEQAKQYADIARLAQRRIAETTTAYTGLDQIVGLFTAQIEYAILANVEHRCYCEDSSHAPDNWCHNSAEGGAVADYVGNVCRQCADTHYSDYVIWPEPLLDERVIYTVQPEILAGGLPGVDLPTRPAYDGMVYVPLTREQIALLRVYTGRD